MAIVHRQPKEVVITEADVARHLVAWLRDGGWTVYQEVRVFGYGGRIADLVAVLDRRIWVIETKMTLGLSVVEQAEYWLNLAHWVSVATPQIVHPSRGCRRSPRTVGLLGRFCAWLGIGRIAVTVVPAMADWDIREFEGPRLNRNAQVGYIRDALQPLHETFCAAGGNRGGYLTSFALSRQAVVRAVIEHPGLTMRELLEHLGKLHYASSTTARACLAKWIGRGVIPGIEMRRSGRTFRYYPKAEVKSK